MLYYIVKPIIRIALLFFCRKIEFNTTKYFKEDGPLLLAVNHPNSFLDAIIIGSHFKKPVYFLARGDAFKGKWALKVLTALKCIPVYRLREGKEYLHLNDATFEKCRTIFKQNGIVLIFSEGLCENEWILRPLKKGTARLTFSSWALQEIGSKLKVLPIGISYNSFRHLPKRVWVSFGDFITRDKFTLQDTEGSNLILFNTLLKNQLEHLCINGINKNDRNKDGFSNFLTNTTLPFAAIKDKVLTFNTLQNNPTHKSIHLFKTIVLFSLSLPAFILYFPFYKVLKSWVWKKSAKSVHYDSILFAIITLFFSFWQVLLLCIAYLLVRNFGYSVLIICLLSISCYFLTKFLVHFNKLLRHNKLTTKQKNLS